MPTSSTVWCRSTSRSPCASIREVEAGVLAELLEHVVEERDAGRDRRRARAVDHERRARSSSPSSPGASSRLSRRSRDHLRQDRVERGKERVVLGGRADRDAEAALDAAATTRSRARARRARAGAPTGRARRRRRGRAGSSRPTARPSRPGMSASAANSRPRSSTSDATRCSISRAEVERDGARDLRRHRERVRQQHLLELGDHPRRRDREAEAHRGQRPHLRVGAHDDERAVVVDELERAPRRELAVGLVDDEQRADFGPRPRAAARRSRAARPCRSGCSGCTRTRPTAASTRTSVDRARRRRSRSRRRARRPRPRSPVIARDLRVQRVGRLEDQRAPAGAAVGEQQRLQHLVAAVRAEQALARLTEERAERVAQLVRAAIGIAVPVDRRAARPRSASTNSAGGAYGLSLVLRRTGTSTCGEW